MVSVYVVLDDQQEQSLVYPGEILKHLDTQRRNFGSQSLKTFLGVAVGNSTVPKLPRQIFFLTVSFSASEIADSPLGARWRIETLVSRPSGNLT